MKKFFSPQNSASFENGAVVQRRRENAARVVQTARFHGAPGVFLSKLQIGNFSIFSEGNSLRRFLRRAGAAYPLREGQVSERVTGIRGWVAWNGGHPLYFLFAQR